MVTAFSLLLVLIGSIVVVRILVEKIFLKNVILEKEKILESKNKSIAAAVGASVIYAKTNGRSTNTAN